MRKPNKIIEGLKQAIAGEFSRATFHGIDFGSGDRTAVVCPRCDATSSWVGSVPHPPHCWQCRLEFKFIPTQPNAGGRERE